MRLTDEQGIMLAVNPAFCQIVGLPAEELVGRPYTAIYSDTEDLAEMMQKYQQRFAEKKIESQFERHVDLPLRQGRRCRAVQFLHRSWRRAARCC